MNNYCDVHVYDFPRDEASSSLVTLLHQNTDICHLYYFKAYTVHKLL